MPRPFEEVVDDHGAAVMGVLRSYLPAADADDAWSDTFLAAMRAYPDLRPDSNVLGWLMTIARHKAIDLVRRRDRAPLPVDDLTDAPSDEALPEPPDDELRAALATLTTRQRDAVIYHHIAGLPYAEVGILLGSSESAARRCAADGIARLRSIYRGGGAR